MQAGITKCMISVAKQTHNHSRVAAFRALQVLEVLNRVASIPERRTILQEFLDEKFVDCLLEVSILRVWLLNILTIETCSDANWACSTSLLSIGYVKTDSQESNRSQHSRVAEGLERLPGMITDRASFSYIPYFTASFIYILDVSDDSRPRICHSTTCGSIYAQRIHW